jgi:excisionase family DNA binding protein
MTETMLCDDLLIGARPIGLYLGMSRRTIYHHIERGRLPITRLGRTIVARKSALSAALSATDPILRGRT